MAAQRNGYQRFRTEQPPYSILLRGVEANRFPTAQTYGMGVLTFGPLASGWLSGRADPTTGHRADGRGAPMFDMALPANQAKLAAVQKLSALATEAGLTLPHLATAFVRAHPAVTSVLIGPRTMAHLQDLLAGTDLVLTQDVLDVIDEIVPPGTDLNPRDVLLTNPALADKTLRRRPGMPT